MLHITILPQESAWRTFLKNLKFVVVDELHVYNGLFGSHVAYIMRRLRRICAAVGNRHVKFISCSATVANPEQHMKSIFGVQDVKLVDYDGSPSGRKEFICWNTPFRDPADPTTGRGDSVAETARLFCQLILRGVRVIAFCRVRKLCEILLQSVRTEFQNLERPEVGKMVMGYRGGYSPQDRRRIEKEMFEGKLMGIVATNALELGVDIGSLDAVITLGFPYSISNLRQQSGRAGLYLSGRDTQQTSTTCRTLMKSSRGRTASFKSTCPMSSSRKDMSSVPLLKCLSAQTRTTFTLVSNYLPSLLLVSSRIVWVSTTVMTASDLSHRAV